MTAMTLFDIFKGMYPDFAEKVIKYKQISKNELQMITQNVKERYTFKCDQKGNFSFTISTTK